MTREDFLQPVQIDYISLDELKHARFIFCPARFERDGGEVLCGKDASRRAFHIFFDSLRQGFLHKSAARRKELDRPASNDDMYSYNRATKCQRLHDLLVGDQCRLTRLGKITG